MKGYRAEKLPVKRQGVEGAVTHALTCIGQFVMLPVPAVTDPPKDIVWHIRSAGG
jgi:hypothetical protein